MLYVCYVQAANGGCIMVLIHSSNSGKKDTLRFTKVCSHKEFGSQQLISLPIDSSFDSSISLSKTMT